MNKPRHYRLLVIDDNPSIAEDCRKILARPASSSKVDDMLAEFLGTAEASRGGLDTDGFVFAIDAASQGKEGVDLVQQAQAEGRPYALAFVDMRMPPGWDGLRTIEELRKVDADVQLCLCTAYSDHTWADIVSRVGGLDSLLVLKKPAEAVEILQVAHALCEKWTLQQKARQRIADLEVKVAERTRHLVASNRALQEALEQRDRMEEELRLAQKLEAIGQLAAGVAHEINTPIQYVGDNAEFLENAFACATEVLKAWRAAGEADDLDALRALREEARRTSARTRFADFAEEVPEACEQMQIGIEQVSEIVRALKEFSHPSSTDRMPADLNHCIETTLVVAKNEYKHLAELDVALGPGLDQVPCIVAEVNQVFLNLVVNAAHAIADARSPNAPRGTIRIVSRREGNFAVVVIEDTGAGVPTAIQHRIFDPFFTTKEVGRGSGQGLAIANRIVRRHNGTLRLDTSYIHGARFVVRLPIQIAERVRLLDDAQPGHPLKETPTAPVV